MTTTTAKTTTNTHAASNAERMRTPQRHADRRPIKKWPGFPGARTNEQIGGGYFVFKRGTRTGRIENRGIPFEHPTLRAALAEAARLQQKYGGTFQVFAMEAEAMPLAADNDDWDFDPRVDGPLAAPTRNLLGDPIDKVAIAASGRELGNALAAGLARAV